MPKFNAGNERIKRRYLSFLTEAKQLAPETVDQVAASLADFEAGTGYKSFALFRIEWAESYKRRLDAVLSTTSARPLSASTKACRLAVLKAFFQWLSQQSGFKSRISYTDAEYFNASGKDARIAKGTREKRVPSIEQIRSAVEAAPGQTVVELRNRALMAFTLVSGARDNAIASMRLRHVDVERRRIIQDPREGVRTKKAKTIVSIFFPVGQFFEDIVIEWIGHLQTDLLFGPDDPLFPATKIAVGANGLFEQAGLSRNHWKDAGAVRIIFKESFERARLPYFNPHSFRSTIALLGERCCSTPEEFKAWSQNLGHTSPLTTFTSYGAVSQHRQDEILEELAKRKGSAARKDLALIDPTRLERIEEMLRAVSVGKHSV